MAATLQSALSSQHALVCVVSDARALFEIAGLGARDALAKLTPADLSRDAFTVGTFRRTRMAQIPAGIGAMDEDRFLIMCFRSVAEYTFEILKLSAQKGGEVGFHS
jgi:sarcosine oxidase subunit gamma